MYVATESSLKKSMDNALKHYSSLFFLPSFRKTLAAVGFLCIGIVGLSTVALFPSFEGFAWGLFLGISLFVLTLFFDWVVSNLVLKKDLIFDMRRTFALSLFCWVVWLAFVIPAIVFGVAFASSLWINFCLVGFSAVLTLRFVVFIASTATGFIRGILASLLQPFSCILFFLFFWARIDSSFPIRALLFLFISPVLSFASAYWFVSLIDRLGRRTHGVPAISIFRAFMLNWVVGLNEPIEDFLERMGEDEDVEVSFLKFASHKTKAAIIVPLVHPGPFKNIGSSLLPSMLKHEFEKELGGDACIPLGILGHELDLASQKQNRKIISHVIASAKLDATISKATPFFRVADGFATVSCQIFGNAAFLSFTLAPKTTEDLPQELGHIVRDEAAKRGLGCSIVVNAHNSITDTAEMDERLDALRNLASKCLDKTLSLPSQFFEVGAATVYPKEFSLNDGMGTGGITAIVVKVAEQRTAYVIIDGNNMISGLRERILSALSEKGFDASEVFTTDTHAVSAVVLGRRGYHPVGEAMDHDILIAHIEEAASTALSRLETCNACCSSFVVPQVRVIGGSRINSLTTLVDEALQKAKRITVPIFAFEGFLLVLLLAVL
jgi:putative membrane protein